MHSYLGQKRLWRTLAVPWLSIEQFVLKGPFKPTVRNHVEDVICGLQLLNIDKERTNNISENSWKTAGHIAKWLRYLHSGEHHPTEYLAKRLEKESKIGLQLGTLGGGNHFLEVVYSEDDEQVGLMLSGLKLHEQTPWPFIPSCRFMVVRPWGPFLS